MKQISVGPIHPSPSMLLPLLLPHLVKQISVGPIHPSPSTLLPLLPPHLLKHTSVGPLGVPLHCPLWCWSFPLCPTTELSVKTFSFGGHSLVSIPGSSLSASTTASRRSSMSLRCHSSSSFMSPRCHSSSSSMSLRCRSSSSSMSLRRHSSSS